MNVALPRSLTVDEFLAWAARQEEGRYELVDGTVIMQQSEQWRHSKVKFALAMSLHRAVAASGLLYFAAPDGPTVRISKRRAFGPDALVAPLPEPDAASLEVANPVIEAEVLSPSTARIDASTKLRGYFEVASVMHYLIVDPEDRAITHHRRGADAIETTIVTTGRFQLKPPGIVIDLTDIFGAGPQ